jgi:hypothetical protein
MPAQRNHAAPAHSPQSLDAESARLQSPEIASWRRWGPYLADRQWGTVREDYSRDGDCWSSFSHDMARSRAYRWGEDGLLGISDDRGLLCFGLSLWNGKDPILKERLFGLTGPEGNHGEDVKEEYFYLDNTPTHSYMRALYKYPQREFPYARLVEQGRTRGRHEREFELADAGAFDEGRYFDVEVEYAKAGPEDVLARITITNRGPDAHDLHVLPTAWFRNTWSWECAHGECEARPRAWRLDDSTIALHHPLLGDYRLRVGEAQGQATPEWLFTDNETNHCRLWGTPNSAVYVKDAFHERIVHERTDVVNPAREGTKAGAWFTLHVPAGGTRVLHARLSRHAAQGPEAAMSSAAFAKVFADRSREADAFYASRSHDAMDAQQRPVARQAIAGLLWSKQFYLYDVARWLDGDCAQPPPPQERKGARNAQWRHLNNADVLLMPDGWEYPWFAAWDLAFHAVALAPIDAQFAKDQLVLMLREWYMHPNGQIPAYEFAFGDVNPPVHAWAAWRVYKMTGAKGQRDRVFLARCFQKLLLNFTWWVNRKDPQGRNLFAGGFLGLDNIGVFDRSQPLPTGGHLEQADGTAWMAFYCGTMLSMALELAKGDPAYEDIATKFFEHFIAITDAINTLGGTGLWDERDGFYYDQLQLNGNSIPLRVRSLVGVVPLLAVEVLDGEAIDTLPDFRSRMEWFLANRTDIPWHATCACAHGETTAKRLLAIPTKERLLRVVQRIVDEHEFLSPHGVRSLSRVHEREPYVFNAMGQEHRVDYTPGESTTGLFGGNSNWRGPIWFPLNHLLIEALERYHHFYGDELRVECPAGSGRMATLREVARELRQRLVSLFTPGADGHRPCHDRADRFAHDPAWKDLILFYEHFHGDTGRGLGASHQTGWTALVHLMAQGLSEDAARAGAAPKAATQVDAKPPAQPAPVPTSTPDAMRAMAGKR